MTIAFRLALAAAVAHATLSSTSIAQVSATATFRPPQAVKPFRPVKTISEDYYLCDYFLTGWNRAFDAKGPLHETTLDLEKTFHDMTVMPAPANGQGFYNRSQPLVLDFDGDGANEVLHFDSNDIGWRYLGVSLYLFDSEADYEKAKQSKPHQAYGGVNIFQAEDTPIPGASFRKLMDFEPVSVLPIVQDRKNGKVYTYTVTRGPWETEPQSTDLIQLNAEGGPKTVCRITLLPPKNTLAPLRDPSRVFAGLKAVRGDSEGCNGSMGWRAAAIDDRLATIVHRPWAIPAYSVGDTDEQRLRPRQSDAAREIRYLVWGASDPYSWRDYLSIKQGRGGFTGALEDHYLANYTALPERAEEMADNAWRWLLDGVIYGRNEDAFTLVRMANEGYGGDVDLPLTLASPPSRISQVAIDAWLASQAVADTGSALRNKPRLATSALLASIYGGADIHRIKAIAELREKIWNAIPPPGAAPRDGDYMAGLTLALLASLIHEDQRITFTMLEMGADPSAKTNWFGKTPLMYAAQLELAARRPPAHHQGQGRRQRHHRWLRKSLHQARARPSHRPDVRRRECLLRHPRRTHQGRRRSRAEGHQGPQRRLVLHPQHRHHRPGAARPRRRPLRRPQLTSRPQRVRPRQQRRQQSQQRPRIPMIGPTPPQRPPQRPPCLPPPKAEQVARRAGGTGRATGCARVLPDSHPTRFVCKTAMGGLGWDDGGRGSQRRRWQCNRCHRRGNAIDRTVQDPQPCHRHPCRHRSGRPRRNTASELQPQLGSQPH
ncbi:MAG: hypothetical protein QM773_03135 [Hyphomonadaceae bacterium]